MAEFATVAIGRVIMHKYLTVLKLRRDERLKIKMVRRALFDNLMRNVFYKFRNVVYRRKLTNFVQH